MGAVAPWLGASSEVSMTLWLPEGASGDGVARSIGTIEKGSSAEMVSRSRFGGATF